MAATALAAGGSAALIGAQARVVAWPCTKYKHNNVSYSQLRVSATARTSAGLFRRRSCEHVLLFSSRFRRRFVVNAGQNVAETESEVGQESEDDQENATEDSKATTAEEKPASVVTLLLQSYRHALIDGDETSVADIEGQIQAIEEEKISLIEQVKLLTEDLSKFKERFLRLNADFDNFRKRSEKERLNLVSSIQGEIISSLLPIVDNFERAKAQINIQTEGEDKIDKSYQGIYKQFVEIMKNLQVKPVDTIGKPFDPMHHEAIMREESTEFEEGIVMEEFRRGFQLGDQLLRPAMVKVSAGPGPAKVAADAPSTGADATRSVLEDADDSEEAETASGSGDAENEA